MEQRMRKLPIDVSVFDCGMQFEDVAFNDDMQIYRNINDDRTLVYSTLQHCT